MSERPDFERVLTEHRLHASMNICMGCDWRATPDIAPLHEQHGAHLAAALNAEVDRWLADDGTRDLVARAIHAIDAPLSDWDDWLPEATAALAALTTPTDTQEQA